MEKCENCLYKHKVKYLEKENEQLEEKLNTLTVQIYNTLVENFLLKDKIKHLEKEIKYENDKT